LKIRQQKIETSMFSKTAADINYLKQDEALPGGRTITYFQNYIIRLDSAGMLKSDEAFGIKGFRVLASMVKSRSNAAGNSTLLVFDQANGMDSDLSSFEQLKDMKVIAASASMQLPNLPGTKFSQKNLKAKLASDEVFREAFDLLVHETFCDFIPQDKDSWDDDSGIAAPKTEDDEVEAETDETVYASEEDDAEEEEEEAAPPPRKAAVSTKRR
jgi:hypothetical protein